ncbi:hypothetical protein SNEBB_002713 [Seison nebaliae]|nr:hypothetical protein SNEBB_002713 [Seison nebaliae]
MNSLKLIFFSISLILSFSLIEANISDVPADDHQIDPMIVTHPQPVQVPFGKGRGWFRRTVRKIKNSATSLWERLTGRKASWKIECIPKLQKNCCWPWDIDCIKNGK